MKKIDWSEVEWRTVVAPLSGRWVPLYLSIFHLSTHLIANAIAIGDTANPIIPDWLGASLAICHFPMFYLWFPIGEWLKYPLSDSGVIELFAAIDALFWTHMLIWIASRLGVRKLLVAVDALFSIHLFIRLLTDLPTAPIEAKDEPE